MDLCRLADLPPIGVISELVNDDGTVMKGEQITAFAAEKGFATVTVADLIAYRQRRESLVERLETFAIETPAGRATAHTYRAMSDPMHHVAVVFGDIRDGRGVLTRLQIEDVLADTFGPREAIGSAIERIGSEGRGVIVYLREGSVGVRETEDGGPAFGDEREAHGKARTREEEWLEIGLGAQILKDLGVTSIKLLASRERHYVGLEGFGIGIDETVVG